MRESLGAQLHCRLLRPDGVEVGVLQQVAGAGPVLARRYAD